MAERVPMTKTGFQKLKDQIHRLKTVDRPKIIKEIEEALAHGDISENAEFHAAKERQAHISAQIAIIDDKLARAQVIDPAGQLPDRVRFGATVVLSDTESGEEVSYTIVGEDESDVSRGTISVTSPIARAVMNKAVDDEVTVRVPKGIRGFEIVSIRFD